MKILLINQAFVSPDEPGHTRHFEFAQYLKSQGHELIIVASDTNYQTGERTVTRSGLYTEQNIQGIRVLRSYIYPGLHKSFFWRIVSFLSFMIVSVWTSLHAGPIDVVLGTSPPIFQAVSAWFVAFLRRKPFILEVRDLWPVFAVDMGVLKNPVLIALSKWLEHFLYARAKHILVNSPAYVDYLISQGIKKEKISFIAYGADIQMFSPSIDGTPLRKELGIDDKFVAVYAGALGLANNIDVIIRAAERLRDQPDIQFVFFGDGKERKALIADVEKRGLTNVLFAGTRPKNEMPVVIRAADVCIAILKDIPMFRTTYPNKVFDYMAAERPTLLAIGGVIQQVIEDSQGGTYIEPGNDLALANAVRDMYQNREATQAMGKNARAYVVEHFDRETKLNETLALFTKIVES